MHLVQIFLPLDDNDGNRLPPETFDRVRGELVQRFQGLTAYSRAPADGLWRQPDKGTARDDIVIYEVMAPALDQDWWKHFRQKLEKTFRQHTILIRASEVTVL